MKTRLLPITLLIIYIAILIKVMVFKAIPLIHVGQLMLNFGGANAGSAPNFVPFKTIVPYLFGAKGLLIGGINLAGNIILLVPLGFLVILVFRNRTENPTLQSVRNLNWKKMLGIAVVSGLIIEVMQVVLRVGIFDIDDVILNAVGFMVGYGSFVLLRKWLRAKKYKTIAAAVLIFLAFAVAAFFYVFPRSITDPENSVGEGDGNISITTEELDLCNGTGGNGEIISTDTEGKFFVLKYKNGKKQTINLTETTEIKASSGPAAASDFKIGDNVTLVGGPNKDGSFTAEAVLVCKADEVDGQ